MYQAGVLARHIPAWTDPRTGLPRSWPHFVWGMRALGRDDIMRTLETAGAVRAGGATEEDYTDWRRELLEKAGS